MFRLSFFRRFARMVAVLVLLMGPVGLQHSGTDDLACAPAGERDVDGAAIGTAADAADHCLVCHWMRSLRSPSAEVAGVHAELALADGLGVRPPEAPRAPALNRVPARAPPRSR